MRFKIIHKQKLHFLFKQDGVVIFDKLQATSFNCYGNTNRQSLDTFMRTLRNSNKDEYDSWLDVLDLSSRLGVIGNGARLQQQWFEKFES